jgi:hypothetical protein
MWAIGAGGAIALLVWRGWTWGAGWVIGTAVSASISVGSTTDGCHRREAAKPRKAVFWECATSCWAGRHVILKYSAISLPAALAGLFVSVAAVIAEILFELAYARNGTVDH